MKKKLKKLFSGLVILMVVISQTPLSSILGTIQTVSAASEFTVVTPNGSEHRNGTRTITWTTTSLSEYVDVWYCTDGDCVDTNYTPIATGQANSGSYVWDTTTAGGDSDEYKVRVSLPGGANGDISNNYFSIDNTAPTVNAGDDEIKRTLFGHGTATISDTNGVVSQTWSKVSGPGEISFGSTGSVGTTMAASEDGTYVIQLLVTDTFGNTGADTMELIWDATAPVISLEGSTPVTVEVGTTYSDAGATVTDAREGDISDHVSIVSNVNTALVGSYTVTYNADDTLGNHATQVVRTVNVTDTLSPVVASMGSTTRNSIFTQTGTVADTGVIASYLWSQTAGTGTITFGTPTALGTTISASEDGVYTIQLLTTDASGNTGANTLTLTWDASKPTVDVGSDIITNGGLTITGVVNGDIVGVASYLWLNDDTGLGLFTVGGSSDHTQNITITNATANAKYTLGLLVTDNAGNTGYDTMELTWDTVAPYPNFISRTPNPGSGTIEVIIRFTEAVAGIDTSIAPTVLFNNGTDHAVTAKTEAHTNGFLNANTKQWEGTIDVSGLTNTSTGFFTISGTRDLAGNTMGIVSPLGSSTIVDTVGPTFTLNDGTAAGPVKTDTINILLSDSIGGVASTTYGFSTDDTCDGTDSYAYSFTNNTDFNITGDHTNYLCIKGVDGVGNISYTGGFLLNTDNTAPTITTSTLTSPTTISTYWPGSSNRNITWNSGQIADDNLLASPITLEYSTNGSTWTTIATGLTNTGVYVWTIPETNSQSALVKITATDEAGNTSFDVSNNVFTIDSGHPATTISNIVSGQVIAGSARPISFATTDNYGINRIYLYYDNVNNTNKSQEEYFGLGIAPTPTTTALISTGTLDTTLLADGVWYLYSFAGDMATNATYSTITPVTVDNTKPAILGNVINFPSEVSTSGTLAGRATHGTLNISGVEYFIDTIGSNGAGSPLTLGSGTLARDFGGTVDVSGLSNGFHTIYVHAMNSEGVRGTGYANKTFEKVAVADNSVVDITSLYVSSVADTGAILYWTSDIAPDTQQYRIKLNNGTYGSYKSLSLPQSLTGLTADKTYIVEIKLTKGSNISTDTVSFTTAGTSSGMVIHAIDRITNSGPTVGGDYGNGYHYRFYVTINNLAETLLQFKLTDRSNGATTMAVANNSLIKVSEDGNDDYSTGTTLTASDTYTTVSSNISALDHDTNVGGRQVYVDLFYKIPTGAGGVYTTSYGIRAQ